MTFFAPFFRGSFSHQKMLRLANPLVASLIRFPKGGSRSLRFSIISKHSMRAFETVAAVKIAARTASLLTSQSVLVLAISNKSEMNRYICRIVDGRTERL
jgi:hypothetical protein